MTDLDAIYLAHPSVQFKPDGDGAILLHLDTQQYFELNSSGRTIWGALTSEQPPTAIAEGLVLSHALPLDEAVEHVQTLLTLLVREGLLQPKSGKPERRRDRWLRRLRG